MMPEVCCWATDRAFSADEARMDAWQYVRHGPAGQSRHLPHAIRSAGFREATLLDIDCGIGAIHHELLEDVVRTATQVETSSAYLDQASEESSRRGGVGRVIFWHADFLDVAPDLPPADIVTLDRGVCCYPDLHGLLHAAASRSRHLLGLAFLRETWYHRLGLAIINFLQLLQHDPCRMFIHPVEEMDSILVGTGLRRIFLKRQFVLEEALFSRT